MTAVIVVLILIALTAAAVAGAASDTRERDLARRRDDLIIEDLLDDAEVDLAARRVRAQLRDAHREVQRRFDAALGQIRDGDR